MECEEERMWRWRDGIVESLTRHLEEEVELRARKGGMDIGGRREGRREEGSKSRRRLRDL